MLGISCIICYQLFSFIYNTLTRFLDIGFLRLRHSSSVADFLHIKFVVFFYCIHKSALSEYNVFLQLRITVWSLINKSVSYIKYPKACQKGRHFTSCYSFLFIWMSTLSVIFINKEYRTIGKR